MIEEMSQAGMWINFPGGERLEVEYLADDDMVRVSYYRAGEDAVCLWIDAEPERSMAHNHHTVTFQRNGLFCPSGVVFPFDQPVRGGQALPFAAYFLYDTVTLKRIGKDGWTVAAAAINCSRLMAVVRH